MAACNASPPQPGGRGGTLPTYHSTHTLGRHALHCCVVEAGCEAEEETPGIIDGTQERPGDVTIMGIHLSTHSVAVDFTVAHLITPSHCFTDAQHPGHAQYSQYRKHAEATTRAHYERQDTSI